MYTVIGATNFRTRRVLWMLEELGAPYTRTEVAPQEHRVPAIKDSLASQYARAQSQLVALWQDGAYVAGDGPSVPDCIAGHCLNWGQIHGVRVCRAGTGGLSRQADGAVCLQARQ